MVEHIDVTVFVLERDIYACQAIVSYLGWDRRTHVVGRANALHEMTSWLDSGDWHVIPDAIILDTELEPGGDGLERNITSIRQRLPNSRVICLAHQPDPCLAIAAAHAGSCGYLVRSAVGVALASAVCLTLRHQFMVTHDVMSLLADRIRECPALVETLPERRKHPHLTQRLEQALSLCVIEGLPAEVAAEEMGVSTSTVRSYIKEVYRILEAEDDSPCPPTMSPVERAFVRYSALNDPMGAAEYPSPLSVCKRISSSVLPGRHFKGAGVYAGYNSLFRSPIANHTGGASGPIKPVSIWGMPPITHGSITLFAQLLISGPVNGRSKD